jgi:hypothetical protein
MIDFCLEWNPASAFFAFNRNVAHDTQPKGRQPSTFSAFSEPEFLLVFFVDGFKQRCEDVVVFCVWDFHEDSSH